MFRVAPKARFNSSLGQRPRALRTVSVRALKARFNLVDARLTGRRRWGLHDVSQQKNLYIRTRSAAVAGIQPRWSLGRAA
jgi:hypothetical protein